LFKFYFFLLAFLQLYVTMMWNVMKFAGCGDEIISNYLQAGGPRWQVPSKVMHISASACLGVSRVPQRGAGARPAAKNASTTVTLCPARAFPPQWIHSSGMPDDDE
jgi:hypothetical protein